VVDIGAAVVVIGEGNRAPQSIAAFFDRVSQIELFGMPKNKSIAGPMTTQPIERAGCVATPALPMMPTTGKLKLTRAAQTTKQSTRADGLRVAKAKISRRNSLRKQREALRG
jgi:hypothetical protein